MPDRHENPRHRRLPPTIRRPRVPGGQRLVREAGWLTTDHPQALWYRVVGHSADWNQVRVLAAATPGAEAFEIDVSVRPDGYVVPLRTPALPGAEAIRIVATAIRAKQRRGDP